MSTPNRGKARRNRRREKARGKLRLAEWQYQEAVRLLGGGGYQSRSLFRCSVDGGETVDVAISGLDQYGNTIKEIVRSINGQLSPTQKVFATISEMAVFPRGTPPGALCTLSIGSVEQGSAGERVSVAAVDTSPSGPAIVTASLAEDKP